MLLAADKIRAHILKLGKIPTNKKIAAYIATVKLSDISGIKSTPVVEKKIPVQKDFIHSTMHEIKIANEKPTPTIANEEQEPKLNSKGIFSRVKSWFRK